MKKGKNQKKSPYQKPRIASREIYEINALGCSKCPSASTISYSISCIRGTKKFS